MADVLLSEIEEAESHEMCVRLCAPWQQRTFVAEERHFAGFFHFFCCFS